MGVNFVFVSGVGKSSLKKGPGHYDGSPLPGLPGRSRSPATGPRTRLRFAA